MHRIFVRTLLGVLLIGGLMAFTLTAPYAFASPYRPASVPGCNNNDYTCGYLHGFADARAAYDNGLCGRPEWAAISNLTPSEQGYRDAFEHYCPI
jgi:hypothetical protein